MGGEWFCYQYRAIYQTREQIEWYDLLGISHANIIEISNQELYWRFNSQSCDSFQNFIHPYSPSSSVSFEIWKDFTTLFKCTEFTSEADVYFRGYHNYTKCPGYSLYYSDTGLATTSFPPNCQVIQLPLITLDAILDNPFNLITPVLLIRWHLTKEGSQQSTTRTENLLRSQSFLYT